MVITMTTPAMVAIEKYYFKLLNPSKNPKSFPSFKKKIRGYFVTFFGFLLISTNQYIFYKIPVWNYEIYG